MLYQRGVVGRVHFKIAEVYWRAFMPSCIYFWVEEKPQLPSEMVKQLKSELGETRTELGEIRTELGEIRIKLGETRRELKQIGSELGETQ